MNPEGWNPDQACEEMAALFAQADRIMQQPHYLKANADSMDSSSAGSLPSDQENQSIRTNSNHVTRASANGETAAANGVSEPACDNAAHP